MSLQILESGFLTTVQDEGRVGFASLGYPECGACDTERFYTANLLAGNPRNAAVLECTLLGPTLRFQSDHLVVVAGSAPVRLNGKPAPCYAPLIVHAGDILSIGALVKGLRAYLAVYGSFALSPVFGSLSTDLRCHLGGFHGRSLQKDDILPAEGGIPPFPDIQIQRAMHLKITQLHALQQTRPHAIHVISGPQEQTFTEKGMHTFVSSGYTVLSSSNRMALRLDGDAIETFHGSDILSDAIALGSIQVASDGQPMVMLSDHQTTGGYAKIGTVIPQDIPYLAQSVPGDVLHFTWIDYADALLRYRTWMQHFDCIESYMKGN